MTSIFGFDRRDGRMLTSLFKITLTDRFMGSRLGLVWAVLSPLMLMATFTFVFTFVFPGRLPGREGTLPFVIWLLSGYAPWLCIAEGLMASTAAVVSAAGVVKNISFKSEMLPVTGAMLGLVPLVVGICLILVLKIVTGYGVSPAIIFLPISTVYMLAFISGVGLFLSPLNVFIRDTALALPNLLMLFLFSSPIFYPLSAYPDFVKSILVFSPFYVLAELFREPILNDSFPPLWMLVYMGVFNVVLVVAGLWWFRRLKPFFDARL